MSPPATDDVLKFIQAAEVCATEERRHLRNASLGCTVQFGLNTASHLAFRACLAAGEAAQNRMEMYRLLRECLTALARRQAQEKP